MDCFAPLAMTILTSCPRRLHLTRTSGDPPARTGDVLWRKVDRLLEAHQLPVVGMIGEAIGGFACKAHHAGVRAQRIAEQAVCAESGRAAFEVLQQRGANAMALPA